MKSVSRQELFQGPTRRQFLQLGGLAAASLGFAVTARAEPSAPGVKPAEKSPQRDLSSRLGVASYTFRKFDLDKTLAMTKRVGLTYICLKSFHLPLDAKPRQIEAIAAKVRDAGLVLCGVGVISLYSKADIERAFDYAKMAGAKLIVGAPSAEMLPLIDEKVRQFDISVAIHNHGPEDRHFPTPQSAYEKIKQMDRRLGLCIDIGHAVRAGADLVASVEKYADRLLDFHIKDINGTGPKARPTEVGRGVLDIPGFLRALVKVNYRGIVSYEYEIKADDPLPGLAESVGYTRGVLAAI